MQTDNMENAGNGTTSRGGNHSPEHLRTGPSQTGHPRGNRKDLIFMWGLTIAEIVVSIIIVKVVTGNGGSEFSAYLWSLAAPLAGGIVYWAKTRVLSGASVAILLFNLFSAAVALLGSHDARVLLYKDCFVTGIIGLIFAGSTVVGKPITYWYGQRFATGGTPEGIAWWKNLWDQNHRFRRVQRQICLMWAGILVAEALLKAYAISVSGFANAYIWTQVLPIAATVLGVVLTMRVVRRSRRRGEREREAAAAASSAE